MNKLKYINLGLVEPKMFLPIFEYPNLIIPEYPTIFSYSSNAAAFSIGSSNRLDKKVKTENLPKDIKIIRYRNYTNTVYILSPDLLSFVFHCLDINKFKSIRKIITSIVFEVIGNYGIKLTQRNNDIYFIKDGVEKKFFGIFEHSFVDGWKSIIFGIELKFNSDLANRIYRFDDKKFTKKGEITDISKIVGGLYEVAPNIDRNKIIADVIKEIAKRIDLVIDEKSLSEDEYSKMNKLVSEFDDPEWILTGDRPLILLKEKSHNFPIEYI